MSKDIKKELIYYSKKLQEKGFVVGPGGNASCKIGQNFFIKPSGLDFYSIKEKDLVKVDVKTGSVFSHKYKPSSEVSLHQAIYQQRSEVKCVFHTHPPFTVGLSACGIPIKHLFPDSVVYLGKHIPLIEYCTPCTERLAEMVKNSIGNDNVLVLKNHGAISLGENIKSSYLRMLLLENLAYVQWISLTISNNQNSIQYLKSKDIDDILNLESEKYRQGLLKK
ncbi:MAG: class II aldolase/adducin family protein [Promethearchaeota archaeon]